MASTRSESAIRADITVYETARTNAANGKTIQITTSAGTRLVTALDLSDIESTLARLKRELAECLASVAGGPSQQFSLANFVNGAQR